MKVLLTGGSGFVAAHCLDCLLDYGHNVVTTVRSAEKGQRIINSHPGLSKDRLSYVVVKDMASEGAFDEAVKSEPPFDAVMHTASPFHYNARDARKDLINPAIMGTTGILKALKNYAPNVKRVVLTSSFAAMVNADQHPDTYDESSWNPVTIEFALSDPISAYRASKTFAEREAWKFVEQEKPNFSLATISPPNIFGPVIHFLSSFDSLNTSNTRFLDMIQGKMREGLAPTGTYLWVDVRDVALAHVKALEVEDASNKRYFCTAGYATNADIAKIIIAEFLDLSSQLPAHPQRDLPEGVYKYDNSRTRLTLGLQYRPLRDCVVDTVKSLLAARN